jgi:GAF domain-containing protein
MAPMSRDVPADDPLPTLGSEPLVPILRVEEGQADPVTLATWHQALSNTVSVEVPHDLMAIWLYPSQGGVVLLGPSELAADDLTVPLPLPQLKPEQLSLVEEIVLDAGYKSATCLPISFGKRDVALLLVADLQPDRYGPAERVVLQCVAQRVAPMLGRIARQWAPGDGSSSRQQERIAALLEAVAQANHGGATPQRFLAGVTQGLAPLLPHDHVELLVPDASGEQYFRLGEHPGGPLWADPSLVISREHLDIVAIFESRTRLLVPDTYEDARWPRGFLTAVEPAGADVRAVVGVQIGLGAGMVAYLLVGSIGPEIYGADDLELLALLAGLIAPQIAGFMRATAPTPRAPEPPAERPAASDESAELLFRISELLATTSSAAEATRFIADEGAGLLPYSKLGFVLRANDDTGVVMVEPGERRSLTKLPLVKVDGTALGRVIGGQEPSALYQHGENVRLIVPLRAAGRVHGAMVFSATGSDTLTDSHVERGQRLADIVGAHLELLRRATAAEAPQAPATVRAMRAPPATPPRAGSA